MINYSNAQGTGLIKLNVPSGTVNFTEILTNVTYPKDGNEVKNTGLYVAVEPWTAQIFYYNTN